MMSLMRLSLPWAKQNTTFGNIQGFTQKPQTPFFDDEGNFQGVVHQERGLTYVLVDHAGHEVPEYNPLAVRSSIVSLPSNLDASYH